MTTIGSYAFETCTSMTSLVLGDGLTNMGYQAFYGCTGLTSVNCLALTPPNTSQYNPAFSSSTYSDATLRVPPASIEAYRTANVWKQFANIEGLAGAGPGDVNGDGSFTITDVTGLIDAILGGDPDVMNNPYADVNGDGKVTIADVTALISSLLDN